MNIASNKNIKVAVIGCGRIAGHHIQSIHKTKGIDIVSVCDLIEEKSKAYGNEYDIPYFTNYHKMLNELTEVDIVVIATPSGMHFEHSMDIIRNYNKSVIIEKPTFMRPDQLVKAYKTADKVGVNIFPVFQNRNNKAVKRVKQAIDTNELGDIRIVTVKVCWCRPQRYYDMAPWRGTLSHDGGALTNQAIHHVDLLRYLCGPVKKVNAIMSTIGVKIDAEDSVVATFIYSNGALGSLVVTTAARPDDFEASISIVGSKGLAEINGIAVNELRIFTPNPDECDRNSEDFVGIKGFGAVYGYGHQQLYQDIVSYYRDNIPYQIKRKDCFETLNLLHSFYRSDELNDWIEVNSKIQSDRLGKSNESISKLYRI